MSYSFSVRASTADEAEVKVRDELVKVVEQQPAHKRDCDQAFNAAQSLLKLLRAPSENQEVAVSVSGSIWAEGDDVHSLSLNVSAGFGSKGS